MLSDALQSMSRRDAVQAVADMTGLARKQVYAQALTLDAPQDGGKKQEKEMSRHDDAAEKTPPSEAEG